MPQSPTSFPTSKPPTRLVWILTLLLVAIGFSMVVRRTYVLLYPREHPKFAAAATLDAGCAAHPFLTFLHILPAALLICLMPLQFVSRIRARHLAWHRWPGRLLVALGFVFGTSALVMSYTSAIVGAFSPRAGCRLMSSSERPSGLDSL